MVVCQRSGESPTGTPVVKDHAKGRKDQPKEPNSKVCVEVMDKWTGSGPGVREVDLVELGKI